MMNQKTIISSDSEIMNGMLVFAGTPVPVAILIQYLTTGDSLETFLDDFPSAAKQQWKRLKNAVSSSHRLKSVSQRVLRATIRMLLINFYLRM